MFRGTNQFGFPKAQFGFDPIYQIIFKTLRRDLKIFFFIAFTSSIEYDVYLSLFFEIFEMKHPNVYAKNSIVKSLTCQEYLTHKNRFKLIRHGEGTLKSFLSFFGGKKMNAYLYRYGRYLPWYLPYQQRKTSKIMLENCIYGQVLKFTTIFHDQSMMRVCK